MEMLRFQWLLSTKKRYSIFLKKALVFEKIGFKVLETFKISSDCHLKRCRSLKPTTIVKTPITAF